MFRLLSKYIGSWYFFVAYLRRRLITIEKKTRNILHRSAVLQI